MPKKVEPAYNLGSNLGPITFTKFTDLATETPLTEGYGYKTRAASGLSGCGALVLQFEFFVIDQPDKAIGKLVALVGARLECNGETIFDVTYDPSSHPPEIIEIANNGLAFRRQDLRAQQRPAARYVAGDQRMVCFIEQEPAPKVEVNAEVASAIGLFPRDNGGPSGSLKRSAHDLSPAYLPPWIGGEIRPFYSKAEFTNG